MDSLRTNFTSRSNFPITNESLQTVELLLIGILLSFALLGIIGNVLLIHTFKNKDLKSRFNSFMLLLAICDLVYLTLQSSTLIINAFYETLPTLVFFTQCAFSGSVYTTTAIALERYLVFCRDTNTEKYGLLRTILTILSLAVALNSPCYLWYSSNFTYFWITRCFQFLVQAALPSTLIFILNVFLYKQLRRTKRSFEHQHESIRKSTIFSSTRESLKKSIFRSRLTLSITGIFVCSQMIMWLPTLPYEVSEVCMLF